MYNLNISQLSHQLSEFCAAHLAAQPMRRKVLAEARRLLRAQQGVWQKQHQRTLRVPWLMAEPLEDPAAMVDPGERPTPMTAVATDGSQIYPDRHIEPLVYLLNISEIAFQYGTRERPVMSSQTHVGSGNPEVAAAGVGRTGTDLVAALRDEMELEALFSLAEKVRRPARPILCMVDGTLIRWMLQRIEPEMQKAVLIERYAALLARFRKRGIALCSFISMPGSTEVVNLLRGLRGETRERREDSFAGILDRRLFGPLLDPWQRTAVFASESHVLRTYQPQDRICFFYTKVMTRLGAAEIARVELPHWVAGDAHLLELVHAAVVSECRKGNGYPMILAEAHEHAVIRRNDRTLFYHMVERALARHNLRQTTSRKSVAKQRPVV